ncbi:MAG: selenocysteine synthase [Bacillales bacterium]|jgi:L-seryl-tRNA(Ser) seleniumtransferase|nr:selenocysteine synthase [Bacillales bacterium]
MQQVLRKLPAVHELQKHPDANRLRETYSLSEKALTKVIKSQLDAVREDILQKKGTVEDPSTNEFIDTFFKKVETCIASQYSPRLKRIINATGTVLHTNLGRARLSEKAIEQMVLVARNYSNVEYKISNGSRGSRHDIAEELIKEVTGAEAAMVVNNNAAAVFLILSAFGKGREVVVSRGELVEIGGSFRISSIMEESGAILREVGTTNKTRISDYEKAISDETAMLLKVHTSNFKVIGFTESVASEELFALAKSQHLISYEDLGSGALFDFSAYGIGDEPLVRESIEKGADLVSFSGDKLLGGPQAGIIAGRKDLIDKLKKHQLARVLRVDKMTFAALEATLLEYAKGSGLEKNIPTIRDIIATDADIEERVQQFIAHLRETELELDYFICNDESTIGGGTMPGVEIPTVCIGLKMDGLTAEETHRKLRCGEPPVIGKIKDDLFWLDLRTVTNEELPEIVDAIVSIKK